MTQPTPPNFAHLAGDTRDRWNANAEWWDDRIGDGNDFQTVLIEPSTERLLALKPEQQVLDIACGAGRFSRRMAALGARVTAFDFSANFIERARFRTMEHASRIDYRVLDATDRAGLRSLGERRFDAAVCTMALMDIATIEPLIETLPLLLKPSGRFVFSVLHPAFHSGTAKMFMEEEDREGQIVTTYGIKVTDYLTPTAKQGLGIRGQPVPQLYFHRPMGLLFNTCFAAGFALTGMEEPALPAAQPDRRLSWNNYPTVPPILVARMSLVGG